VDGAAKRQVTGTGLGLALVKEIASAHNGKVWVESRLGQGSTFYISLPFVGNDNGEATAV
jgi:signal transduction histidine kinase